MESTTMAKPVVRKPKKKAKPLKAAKVENIEYKDTALLRKFISDRGKIRARRVTGVSAQEQRLIATAVKNAREMALRQADRAVAVVGEEPVVARPHRQSCGHQQRLMPSAGDLEKNLLLPLQHNFAIVRAPRKIHQPVELHQLFAAHRCSRCFSAGRLGSNAGRRPPHLNARSIATRHAC